MSPAVAVSLKSQVETVTVPTIQRGQLSLEEECRELRYEIVRALHACGAGHYGGSLSVVDILTTLYRRHLRISPESPQHPERDRLILSKGHAAIALYAMLRRLGYFTAALDSYATFGGVLEGHPDLLSTPGVDFSTGSLGQGLSAGLGMALASRHSPRRAWVVLGDGECQEGQVWEAALLAAQCRLERLHAVVDANNFQEWGWHRGPSLGSVPVPVADLPEKWRSFGWKVYECNGHDPTSLSACMTQMEEWRGSPSVLIARTIKGYGFPLLEANPQRFHCGELSDSEFTALIGGE